MKISKRLRQPFTQTEIMALWQASKTSLMPVRDEVLFLVLLDTGMRIGQATTLALDHIRLDRHMIVVAPTAGVSMAARTAGALCPTPTSADAPLATLLTMSGQPVAAVGLWVDLMRDPGPPDPERDHGDQYAYREECARSAFECCRALGDVARLVRTRRELLSVLKEVDEDAETAEPVEPEVPTAELYERTYAELTSSTVAGGQ